MKLLVRPEPYANESLESYMLRLASENYFERYQQLSRAIGEWLQLHDHEAAGAFPEELCRLNIYHAAQSSSKRVRALKLIEELTDNDRLPLLHLAVLHSSRLFCSRYQGVFHDGVHIPRALLRQHCVPICPECLREAVYIRQEWHWLPYQACVDHGVSLLDECPECGHPLNYTVSESLCTCSCGVDLRNAETKPAEEWEIEISRLIAGELSEQGHPLLGLHSLSMRFACFLWFQLYSRHKMNSCGKVDVSALKDAVEYFSNWPDVFLIELKARAESAKDYLVKDFNHTRVQYVFGNIILISHLLFGYSGEGGFVRSHIEDFLIGLVNSHPRSRVPNIADLLVSMPEAAVLLCTTHEQVYRLYQEGYLKLAAKLKGHEKLTGGVGAFHLRDIIELRQSRAPIEGAHYNNYVPAW